MLTTHTNLGHATLVIQNEIPATSCKLHVTVPTLDARLTDRADKSRATSYKIHVTRYCLNYQEDLGAAVETAF